MRENRIKIVHILEGFVGGLCTYMCAVLPQLAKNGFDVTLICSVKRGCPNAPELISELGRKQVKVYVIPIYRGIKPFRDLCSFFIILNLLLKNKFDIVHTHCSKAGALGRTAAVLAGIKIRLHSSHCFAFLRCENRFAKLLYLFIERVLGRLTTKFAAVSQSERDAAVSSNIFPYHKCVVIKNCLESNTAFTNTDSREKKREDSRVLFGIDKDRRVVATACRLIEYKGIFRFLEAAKISRSTNTVFLIAGEGRLRPAIERFIHENGLNGKVKLAGYVTDMERLYAVCDVIVLCSDCEGMPYLLLEAMRAKCPVVATAVPGNKELISQDRGMLVKPAAASIAAAIDELLADEQKQRKYTENAYAHFCRHHTLEKQISKLAQVYRSCISARHKNYAKAEFCTE